MRKIDLVPRVTPDIAQALWYEIEAELDSTGRSAVVVCDASAVRHFSSAALQMLMVAQAHARRNHGQLVIANPSDDAFASLSSMGALSLLDEVIA